VDRNVTVRPLALLLLFVLATQRSWAEPPQTTWQATVFGIRAEDVAVVPEEIPYRVRSLVRFPDRSVPPVFRTGHDLDYAVSLQDGPAPLVFLISGTGGTYDESKTRFLQRALFGAGFHVVALPSPTHPSFIVAASEASVPGYTPIDARDLYAVMKKVRAQLEDSAEIDHVVLAGFSLGATEAAFVGALDQREAALGFRRVFLISPAVSIYGSAENLDRLWHDSLPGGVEMAAGLVRKLLRQAVGWIHSGNRGALDAEFLMRFAAEAGVGEVELKQVVASVFRLSAANMAFSADVMTHSGHIVPPDKTLHIGTSLTPFLERSLQWSFLQYMDQLLVPYWEANEPRLDRNAIVAGASLESLQHYLSTSDRIAVMTNADDFMLRADDMAFLERTFGERATIHRHGGHGGNLESQVVIDEMIRFLTDTPVEARP